AGLDQRQAVAADPAAPVQEARARRDRPHQLAQVRLLSARHGERGQVVEIGLGTAVEGMFVADLLELGEQLMLVEHQARAVVRGAEVLAQLGLLAFGVEGDGRHRHSMAAMDAGELRARVGALDWYHTLELAPGVVTPGWFDTRAVAGSVCLPASLEGRRCLDVGTFDGFWAFELERRGAAEVVAIDVLRPEGWDWPACSSAGVAAALDQRKRRGDGFVLAAEALGSRVQRRERSVY